MDSFIPNTTPTPNWLYNGEMKNMSDTELRVVLLITRKTLGWKDIINGGRKKNDYISQSQFMEFTGRGNQAIARAIQVCVQNGWIIAVDKGGVVLDTPTKRARRKVIYQLGSIFLKKVSGVKITQEGKKHKSGVIKNKSSVKRTLESGVKITQYKRNLIKETNTKEINLAKQSFAGKDIQKAIELFRKINPSYERLFSNKTQRASVERLLKKYGSDFLQRAINAAAKCLTIQYAPTITTPYQLESDLGKLIAYYKTKKSKSNFVKITKDGQIQGSIN